MFVNRLAVLVISAFILAVSSLIFTPGLIQAAYDPLSVPNNKFGIHILDPGELDDAANLVNSSGGDWGYAIIVIRQNDRNVAKWTQFFKNAGNRRIIPIVRIATSTEADYWKKPDSGDAENWAEFLSKLPWPTNNHYVIVYNEPNHAREWGNTLDPQGYARELDKTITALKAKDQNAFILNAGLDVAAPNVAGKYMEAEQYLDEMYKAVPDIFNKIDGWASHSYPQPDFIGDPKDTGRNTIVSYRWEQDLLTRKYGASKKPVFITETGWVHQYGSNKDKRFPNENQVANYFEYAFKNVWTDPNLVVVAPFTLNYTQPPFDNFSWVKNGPNQASVLGVSTDKGYYKQYYAVQSLAKVKGEPLQKVRAELIENTLPNATASGQVISGKLSLKNTGEVTWFENNSLQTVRVGITQNRDTHVIPFAAKSEVGPGESYDIPISLLAPKQAGEYRMVITLSGKDGEITSLPYNLIVGNGINEPKNESFIEKLSKFFSYLYIQPPKFPNLFT